MRLTLGPLLYYWPRDQVFAFYRQLAELPLATLYLGEVVCSKRRLLRLEDWLMLGEELAASGKQVILSTLALIEAESELALLERQLGNGRFLLEANDVSAVQRCAALALPFVIGPHINCYNAATLEVLCRDGAVRWVPPLELSGDALALLRSSPKVQIACELFAYGRMPLALSARCFTARHYQLPKDDCHYRCVDHPDGLRLDSQEGERLLVLNGIQTQSASLLNLLPALPRLQQLGIDYLRLSPHSQAMPQVINTFHQALHDGDLERAAATLQRLPLHDYCNGYWYGRAGMVNGEITSTRSP